MQCSALTHSAEGMHQLLPLAATTLQGGLAQKGRGPYAKQPTGTTHSRILPLASPRGMNQRMAGARLSSHGGTDDAVQTHGEEATSAVGGAESDDGQHLSRGAAESNRVLIGGHNVGHAAHHHTLVVSCHADGRAQGGNGLHDLLDGDAIGLHSGVGLVVQHTAHQAGMVGLHSQDASGGGDEVLVGQQSGGALVGGHTHVLEDEGAVQEEQVVGVRVEGHRQRHVEGGVSSCLEAGADVDLGHGHSSVGQGGLQEQHVVQLVLGNLSGVRQGGAGQVGLRAASAGRTAHALLLVQALAVHGTVVELSLEVLQVESEVENVHISDVACRGGGRGGGLRHGRAGQEEHCHCGT
mmetsp:Transcript_13486/g.40800  ORF Transcript_13486/g.40800 Transcript_13486/m.40800 type:complete len:352 (+) Transcript_13486:428-1483(+)